MKAHAIVIKGNDISESAFKVLKKSSEKYNNEFEIIRFDAVKPAKAYERSHSIMWRWPWGGSEIDPLTGLMKNAYKTADPMKRIACFLSHYDLWKACSEGDEPFLILEHDAEFTRNLPVSLIDILKDPYIVGINNPLGATRRPVEFFQTMNKNQDEIQPVPRIDHSYIPQGLAGNSAYIISPKAARDVLEKVRVHGAWPNDALLCYQLFPYLRVTKTYYTRVQGTPSTTTL